jgi:peptide/nickel transport system substrate-binding protein
MVLFAVAIACGDDEEAAAPVAVIDTAALAETVRAAVQAAAPKEVSADEISRLVQTAIIAAAPETATPAEIQQMVRDAVAAAAQPGATKEEIESLVTNAVSQSVAQIQPGVTASEVQKLVSEALMAVPTPATVEIIREVDPRFGGTIRANNTIMTSLDLGSIRGLAAQWAGSHSLESPFDMDSIGIPKPVLVDSWTTSSDGLTYRFTLRDGIKFHDGQPLTAADVVGSFRRNVQLSYSGLIGKLTDDFTLDGVFDNGWKPIDDLTWEIKLERPSNFVIESLGNPFMTLSYVGTKATYSLPIEDSNDDLIGTGPFVMDEWVPGDRLLMSRYEDYLSPTGAPSAYAGRRVPFADSLEFIVIPDQAAQIAAIKTGQLDILSRPFSGDVADQMKDDSDIVIYPVTYPPARMSIWPNHTEGPLSDVRVRQALRVAMPSERILTAAYGSSTYWRTCASMWTCTSFWENPTLDTDGYNAQDLDAARALIAEAGMVGATMRMPVRSTIPQIADSSRIVREVLEELGFVVDWEDMDPATFYTRVGDTRDWDLLITWTTGFRDPFVGNTVHYEKKGWVHQYQDLTNEMTMNLDKLYSEPLTRAEQKMVSDEIQRVFMRDLPVIQLGEGFTLQAARKVIKGFATAGASGSAPLWNLWFEAQD